MESVKLFIVDWICEVLRALSLYFLKKKAIIETGMYIENSEEIDLRKVPDFMKKNIIYDEAVIKMRWEICRGCEFLTDSNRCTKCGCFMKSKTKLVTASSPVGKWSKHTKEIENAKPSA